MYICIYIYIIRQKGNGTCVTFVISIFGKRSKGNRPQHALPEGAIMAIANLSANIAEGIVTSLVASMKPQDPIEKAVADKVPELIDETIDEKRTVTNAARLAAGKEIGKQLDERGAKATKAEKDFYDALFIALTPKNRK